MRFEQFQYLVEVARCSSISQAAINLNISQPSISVALSDLEREIGFRLFDRNKNGTILRPEAKQYFIAAEKVLSSVENFYALSDSKDLNLKNLRISTLPSVSSTFKSELHARFLNHYPNMHLDIRMCSANEIITGVLNWDIDIGIILTYEFPRSMMINDLYNFDKYVIVLHDDARFSDSLYQKPLASTELGICMSYKLSKKFGDKCSLSQISNERILGMSTHKNGVTSYLSNFYPVFRQDNISVALRDYQILFDLCKHEVGIAMVNKLLYNTYKQYYNDTLAFVAIEEPMPKLTYTAICHQSNIYKRSFRDYIDLIYESTSSFRK